MTSQIHMCWPCVFLVWANVVTMQAWTWFLFLKTKTHCNLRICSRRLTSKADGDSSYLLVVSALSLGSWEWLRWNRGGPTCWLCWTRFFDVSKSKRNSWRPCCWMCVCCLVVWNLLIHSLRWCKFIWIFNLLKRWVF